MSLILHFICLSFLGFDELQQIFQLHFLEQKSQQRLSRELTTLVKDNQIEEIWRDFLFPKIKAQVLTVLQSFSVHESVKARANSYELLGVDVLVDQCLDARILEVNMSPAMAHRTPEQSAVIRLMAQQFMALHFLPKLPEPHILKDFQEWIDEEEASFSEALPWQTWQPLHPESVEDSGEAASSPDPIQPQETDARAAPLDDWDVMEEVRPPPLFRSSSFSNNVPRPKSASATTTATASFRRRSFVQNDDPSLVPVPPPPLGGGGSSMLSYVLVGKAVSVSSMNYIDFLCKQFHLIVRLQR